jgi:hypothetical protein
MVPRRENPREVAGRSTVDASLTTFSRAVLVVAAAVFAIFIVVLGVILGSRLVDAVRGEGPTYSVALTQQCLEKRGRSVRYHAGGPDFGPATLEVETFRRADITRGTTLYFLSTPDKAAEAEVSDSERIRRRGNVLFPELLSGATPADPAIDACLDLARDE